MHSLGLPPGSQPRRQRRTRLRSEQVIGNQRIGSTWIVGRVEDNRMESSYYIDFEIDQLRIWCEEREIYFYLLCCMFGKLSQDLGRQATFVSFFHLHSLVIRWFHAYLFFFISASLPYWYYKSERNTNLSLWNISLHLCWKRRIKMLSTH